MSWARERSRARDLWSRRRLCNNELDSPGRDEPGESSACKRFGELLKPKGKKAPICFQLTSLFQFPCRSGM
jgi:hypothetical protein